VECLNFDETGQLVLASGLALIRPEEAVFEGMLTGWARQQYGGRGLGRSCVEGRIGVVRRFVAYTNEFPWNWTPAMVDEWSAHLVGELHRAKSTLQQTQGALKLFCVFLLDPRYGWAQECERRFGMHPVQVCHEDKMARHLADYRGDAGRRPLTREELQALFDYVDSRVDHAVRVGRKGALTAYRDSALFKTVYGWGLRCTEASRLDRADWYRNAKAAEFGRFGMLHVRYGKGSRGSGYKRREVASLMPWAVEAVEDYLTNIWPRFARAEHPAMWLTERGGRLGSGEIDDRFGMYRDAVGLDKKLSLHCLRHSYVTHMVEDGVDPKFLQSQVGHVYQSTTSIYTAVSGDFANTMMRQAIDLARLREQPTNETGDDER
jgi:site-specific recombinase XerD